jgi:hypothetical protein
MVLLAASAAAEEMTPFVIPMTPNEKSLIAMACAPIPVDGPRLAVSGGQFTAGGKWVRIWGVNMCFGADFPTHADAERIAARLAAAGVNSVRFHHMDTQRWPSGILDPKDPLKLYPEAVERLDYFLDQLARRGIYANINLHVGRGPAKALGLPESGMEFDKIVGIFTPALVDAQKQYARDLLTHVNEYRKVRLADDPAVGFVEITNEDSLFMWGARGRLQALPPFYAKLLQDRFVAFLKSRYGGTESLRHAWSKGAEPLGENLLADPKFEMKPGDPKARRWEIERHEGCAARLVRPAGEPAVARLEISQADATNWHLQFKQGPLPIKAGQYYTVAFRARADEPRTISYGVGQAHDPWNSLGLGASARLTPQWAAFRAGFTATGDDDNGRLSFSFGGAATAVEIADVVLAPGGREGLAGDESIEAGAVALFGKGEVEARAMDRMRFLTETEKDYFDDMYKFIKKDLGAKALLTGTIVFGPAGLYGQSGMDYIDSHSYWQHPQFPGRAWDMGNWIVEQKAMVDNPAGATLHRIACERMEGKPFTLSEYNHSAPNDFQAECVPMLAAYAAAQDWDGVWLFAYSHRGGPADRERFDSFFDIDANPSKWGFMRAGAAIFRQEAVPPHKRAFSLAVIDAEDVEGAAAALQARYDLDMFGVVNGKMKTGWEDLLRNRMEIAYAGHSGTTDSGAQFEPALAWAADAKGRGTFSAAGPGAAVLVSHAAEAGPVQAHGLEFSKPAFAAITMTALDGQPLAQSKAILVTACGRCENTGMKFSADRRTVGRDWGAAPVLIEPVEGRVALPPGRWKCQTLAPDGTPKADVPLDKGGQSLRMSPEFKTMWYLLTPAAR